MVKRILLILLVLVMIPSTVILASDVSEALYSATVRATNSSYTAQRVAVPFTLSTDALIDGHYVNSSVNNLAIQDSAGNDMVFMPAPPGSDDFVMYIPQISQNSSVNYQFYTSGDDMSPSIAYFPASTGMTTTDSASMKPGDNFEIIIDGYIDTAAGADKYLVDKGGVLSLYVSGEGEITADVGVSLGYPELVGTTSDYINYGYATIISMDIPDGSAGDYLVAIIHSSRTNDITWPAGWVPLFEEDRFEGAYYVDTDGTGGSVTVTSSPGAYQDYIVSRIYGAGDIEIGTMASSNDPPSLTASWGIANNLWMAITAYTGSGDGPSTYPSGYTDGFVVNDTARAFREYTAATEDPGSFDRGTFSNTLVLGPETDSFSLTASGVNSGEHEVKLLADGTDLKLYIDGVLKDSVALDGASVIDNAADWEYCLNNSVVYLNSLETYVSDVLVQQIEWEYDTTFTDGSGSGNDATPTFRTTSTDADVSATLLGFGVIGASEIDYDDTGTAPIITSAPDEPAQAYGDMDINFPGAAVINTLLDTGRFPQELFWYPLLFGLSAVAGMVAFHFTRSVMMQSLISGTGIALSTLAILQADFWVLIPYVIISLALITSRKTVSL